MCLSVNRPNVVISPKKSDAPVDNNVKPQPLELDLPKALTVEEFKTLDQFSSQLVNVPTIPVHIGDDDKTALRLTEFSPNSAKFEFGKPGEKALITMKARNEERIDPFGRVSLESKVKFDSPYIRHEAGQFAKEAVMNSVVEPLRESIGKTAADATLGTAVLAAAFVASSHLPDGNVKIDIPAKKLIGEENLKTRLIVGYGDGKSLKPTGVEVSNRFEYGSQNIDIKASYRKDAEVNGVKDVERIQLDAVISDMVMKPESGTLSFRAEHNKVTGASVGLFYQKRF